MTLDFLSLYNECAGQPWSMFDNDAESIEDFESAMRISINKAVSVLWNYQPWTFRKDTSVIKTKAGRNQYEMPDGLLLRKVIDGTQRYGIKYKGKFLEYEPDFELLDEKEGEPEYFYIDGDTIYIYPTPDDAYKLDLVYLKQAYALTEDDDVAYELVNDTDYINIPEKYEKLFKNCVISLAMMYAIAEPTDENYPGYEKQYEDALAVLLKYCKNGLVDKNIVW